MSNKKKRKGPFKKFRAKPMWYKVSMTIIMLIVVCAVGTVGYASMLYGRMNYDDGSNAEVYEEEFETMDESAAEEESLVELTAEDINWSHNEADGDYRSEEGVKNILLLGQDATSDPGYRSNTDSIMIATVNVNDGSIKLTSLMRDMYVEVPGYSNNKLNSVYRTGGIQLLYDTIGANFDIQIDGYVLVDFTALTEIIDKLGGVEITLSETEAEYLNTTNYIEDEASRNVKTGTQILNGSQAVGYARIRYIGNSDFERTQRQRNVLNALFEAYKNTSITDLATIAYDIMPYVTTDIEITEMIALGTDVLNVGISSELEQLRLPVDDGFSDAKIDGMSVLAVDFDYNIEVLHGHIFGDTSSSYSDYLNSSDSDGSSSSQGSSANIEFND